MRILISQPMKGKTKSQIEGERAEVVEHLHNLGHTVVDSIFDEFQQNYSGAQNIPLWCLGESFKMIATCDAVFFMDGWEKARGCRMEMEACKAYDVPIFFQSH